MNDRKPGAAPDRASPPPMPRWFKASLAFAGVVVLLFVAMGALVGGEEERTASARAAGVAAVQERGDAR